MAGGQRDVANTLAARDGTDADDTVSTATVAAPSDGHAEGEPRNALNIVRRLTPLECERLMAWPDDHTRFATDGRELTDSVRYRLIGNGVVATVAEWLGWRLMAVDREMTR